MRRLLPFVLLLALASTAGLAIAQESPAEEIEEVEEIEEIEEIEEVEAVAVVNAAEGLGLVELIGRLHPALVHLPIAWLLMVLLLDVGTFLFRQENWAGAGLVALCATVASFVPAIVAGLIRASYIPSQDPAYLEMQARHRNLAFVVGGLALVALALRLAKKNQLTGALRWAYLGLIAIAAALVGLVGHEGGKLVFGADFLPF